MASRNGITSARGNRVSRYGIASSTSNQSSATDSPDRSCCLSIRSFNSAVPSGSAEPPKGQSRGVDPWKFCSHVEFPVNHGPTRVIFRMRSCDRKRQERGVLAARGAESADSQILNRNRGDNRLESDLQPTTSLATFRDLAGCIQPIIVAGQWKVGGTSEKIPL